MKLSNSKGPDLSTHCSFCRGICIDSDSGYASGESRAAKEEETVIDQERAFMSLSVYHTGHRVSILFLGVFWRRIEELVTQILQNDCISQALRF